MSSLLVVASVLSTSTTKAKTSSTSPVFYLVLIVGAVALYFLFLKPRQQRTRAAQQQVRASSVGDEIQTVGGLVGTIVAEEGDRVTISTGNGVELTYLRAAIARKIPPPTPDEPEHDVADGTPELHESGADDPTPAPEETT